MSPVAPTSVPRAAVFASAPKVSGPRRLGVSAVLNVVVSWCDEKQYQKQCGGEVLRLRQRQGLQL